MPLVEIPKPYLSSVGIAVPEPTLHLREPTRFLPVSSTWTRALTIDSCLLLEGPACSIDSSVDGHLRQVAGMMWSCHSFTIVLWARSSLPAPPFTLVPPCSMDSPPLAAKQGTLSTASISGLKLRSSQEVCPGRPCINCAHLCLHLGGCGDPGANRDGTVPGARHALGFGERYADRHKPLFEACYGLHLVPVRRVR